MQNCHRKKYLERAEYYILILATTSDSEGMVLVNYYNERTQQRKIDNKWLPLMNFIYVRGKYML